ncbi:uncharacterized protein LOC111519458 [Drosophila willistoni]|uniref:uncharacterized protein LOC111519458 n=1 Tax=Drosophila willistoni TaxID=7260 RepID=UPI001F074941|nr:uncharacterized protein LOC111519458 [Drosophila willistoni]
MLLVESWCSLPKTYKVRPGTFDIIPNPNYTIATTTLRFVGRERFLNGTVTILEDLDNEHFELSADAYIDPTGGGDYKQLPFFIPRTHLCDILKMYVKPYVGSTLEYNVNTDLPFDGSQCPVPKGTYYFKNILMNTDGWPLVMPLGIMKGVASLYKDNELIGTFSSLLHIEMNGF